MGICATCKHEKCLHRSSLNVGCSNYVKKEQTNADRIRAMTDEELAYWALHKAPEIGREYNESYLGLIKWLQQPAKGE